MIDIKTWIRRKASPTPLEKGDDFPEQKQRLVFRLRGSCYDESS